MKTNVKGKSVKRTEKGSGSGQQHMCTCVAVGKDPHSSGKVSVKQEMLTVMGFPPQPPDLRLIGHFEARENKATVTSQ